MAILAWQPEFSVDIKIIDEQHKKLVETVNLLHGALTTGESQSVLAEVFNNLAEYVTVHFATEEDLMTIHGFPGYAAHKKAHEECTSKVLAFKEGFEKGELNISIDLIMFLVEWLHTHLLEMDRDYCAFFHEKGLV